MSDRVREGKLGRGVAAQHAAEGTMRGSRLDSSRSDGFAADPAPTLHSFYEFNLNGLNPTWTTRFAIADASGDTVRLALAPCLSFADK